eukprot:8924413-Pyramimonas_sp.AAC.1
MGHQAARREELRIQRDPVEPRGLPALPALRRRGSAASPACRGRPGATSASRGRRQTRPAQLSRYRRPSSSLRSSA